MIPQHIGIVMDGNRRWAKSKGINPVDGHRQGLETLVDIVEHATKRGVKFLTVYAFSTENWNRKPEEVKYLMKLTAIAFKKYLKKLHKNSIKLVLLGDLDGVDKGIAKEFIQAQELTKNNTAGTLCICFNYGGQHEIVQAVKSVMKSGIKYEDVDEQVISDNLYHPEVPPVDIMLRTSGEYRISNFMLWRIAYSELMFVDKFWPDFTIDDLDNVIDEYNKRQRRFGV